MMWIAEGLVALDDKAKIIFDTYLQTNKSFEQFAGKYGITDIYTDNNIKQLQQAIYLDLRLNNSRTSFDAFDREGNFWELKSLNINSSRKEFSTSRHLTLEILERYTQCFWAFSVYDQTELEAIYVMPSHSLYPYFYKWDIELERGRYLNNPKISLAYVREHGIKVYDRITDMILDPIRVLQNKEKVR